LCIENDNTAIQSGTLSFFNVIMSDYYNSKSTLGVLSRLQLPLAVFLVVLAVFIGGGAYWTGRAAARPLFSRCGQSLFFARPLFVVENLYLVVIQQCRGL